MKKIQYSSFYLDYDECKNNHFDPRSENIGEIKWAVYDLIMDPAFEDTVREIFNAYTEPIRNKTREEKEKENKYWESTFTEVVDTNAKSMFVRMFENEQILYTIDFSSTRKVNSITEWNK